MSNCMIGFPNRADSATLSGGSWTSGLPLINLQNRVIGKVARSSDATNASTKFDIDLGSAKNIRLLSLVNHNFSLSARYRVRGGNDNTFATTLYDSGWQDVWPVVYPYTALEWEDDNWWSGKYSTEEISGYTTALVVIADYNYVARYWRVEIDDTTNSAGYVQVGRLFIGKVWQPTYNMNLGASIGWSTETKYQRAIGGTKYYQRRTPYRKELFVLDLLTDDEAMANAFEIERRAGIDQELFWIHDPADTMHALRRRFLGTLSELSPVDFPYASYRKKAFVIEEAI